MTTWHTISCAELAELTESDPCGAELHRYPEPGQLVAVSEDYPARQVGEDTEHHVTAGTVVRVSLVELSFWEAAVVLPTGTEVWVCPDQLDPIPTHTSTEE